MKHLNKTTLISILLALFVMVSCKRHNAQLQAFADADGYNNADSLVSAIGDERDFERLLVVTDSLERKGELTEVRAIFIILRYVCIISWLILTLRISHAKRT